MIARDGPAQVNGGGVGGMEASFCLGHLADALGLSVVSFRHFYRRHGGKPWRRFAFV
jgi:hypothetical protein